MSETAKPQIEIFGIRHHGPGSARSLVAALDRLQPDMVLVEGPPDADEILSFAGQADMQPPVALLVYQPDRPEKAVFYPFARFSPEWQAIRHALAKQAAVRFMDLPQMYQLGRQKDEEAKSESAVVATKEPDKPNPSAIRHDPVGWLAAAAGYTDGERWWEDMVEHWPRDREIFTALNEAMAALREAADKLPDPEEQLWEQLREAWMRRTIRAAIKEGFQRIAVICGAWHAPALTDLPPAGEDEILLKGLNRVKVNSTWIAWTHGRLTLAGGYGAGIRSPGWYDHLWQATDQGLTQQAITAAWLVRAAQCLREEDLDVSPAHVIEAVRLAETLAALGGRPLPGLEEINDAVRAVMTLGDEAPLRLLQQRLIVGEALGHIPDGVPTVPLMRDLEARQKKLRLKPQALSKLLDLDLREPTDLQRSHLLHALVFLGVGWGELKQSGSRGRGTFHETWDLQWKPELTVALAEAGIWGNTLVDAAVNRATDRGAKAQSLAELCRLMDQILLADLQAAVAPLTRRLEAMSTLSSDVTQLMDALPPLANVLRYGSVRSMDTAFIKRLVESILSRMCIGFPAACAALDDDAAAEMFRRMQAVQSVVNLFDADAAAPWFQALKTVCDRPNIHGLAGGRACRMLMDVHQFSLPEVVLRLGLALSPATEAGRAAAWLEGFLRNSGMILLHNDALWNAVDEWLSRLAPERFAGLLPVLRRTFATFSMPERKQMGERAKTGPGKIVREPTGGFDAARAEAVLPLLMQLLGQEQEHPL